ncbi:hypothetical protein QBC45DRAFT_396158 [Copromyces sp. CBS 386.78]|nr:hypothetical protein QBC45DRAFT_396158 [Copromyces sp. CBS 386.78]
MTPKERKWLDEQIHRYRLCGRICGYAFGVAIACITIIVVLFFWGPTKLLSQKEGIWGRTPYLYYLCFACLVVGWFSGDVRQNICEEVMERAYARAQKFKSPARRKKEIQKYRLY